MRRSAETPLRGLGSSSFLCCTRRFGFLAVHRQVAAVRRDVAPTREAIAVVVDVKIRLRFAEPEFVVGDVVACEPVEQRLALARDGEHETARFGKAVALQYLWRFDEAAELFGSDDTEEVATRRDLGKLVATLPEKQRTLLEDVKITGLSNAEAAKKAGMTEGAVKVSVHRSLQALMRRARNED